MIKPNDLLSEKWIVTYIGGDNWPYYAIVSSTGRVITLQVPEKEIADLIATLPDISRENERLKMEVGNLQPKKATCILCHKEIEFVDNRYWRHTNYTPRHAAKPDKTIKE